MERYNPKDIEKKWQQFWEKHKTFEVNEEKKKPKFYGLIEFPYPSGAGLHVGHPRSYTAMDVICRKRRMEGYNVLYPIGFDAFGLPTENFAIKTGRPPRDVTKENIANFTRQLKSLGFSFDWSRVVDTTDPAYYKWTQWIFLQLFKHGLAYKKKQPINWCPKDKIGLANEEVVDGCCERCGTMVEKREKEQWMLAITTYADSLLKGLDEVDYIERATIQQKNWIGRSEGAIVKFEIRDQRSEIEVFTTRPDTLFGATYIVVAPEHDIISKLKSQISNHVDVETYIDNAKRKTDRERSALDKEKTGVELQGVKAVNPATKEEIPIWVADYVLASYGTGAIMAVPAHDERDWDFAKKFGLQIKQVIESVGGYPHQLPLQGGGRGGLGEVAAFIEDGICVNSDFLNGMKIGAAKEKMIAWLEEKGIGRGQVNYKLRDWVFSRQRYWGEPIPLVFCSHCEQKTKNNELRITNQGELLNHGWVPLPEDELPLKLPKIEKYQPTDTGESPLAAMTDWVNTKCPKCGGPARRETDTMPNWAGSSWYFLRYADPENKKALASKKALEHWMPIDWYNGGMEHTVLHLLYSRFWNQFLFDIGVVPTREPYKKRTSHGLILGPDGEKMSKSRGNVVNPDEMVEQYGADALRAYILFMGPFDQAVAWDTNGLIGVRRFLERVWRLNMRTAKNAKVRNTTLESLLHQTIKKVTEDIEAMRFNTAIAKLMELTNEMMKEDHIPSIMYLVLVKLLSPFAPHITEELWQVMGQKNSIAFFEWPAYDPALIASDTMTIVVQVNGKLRDTFEAVADISEEEAKSAALAQPNVAKHLGGKTPKKVMYVKGKLVSIVV